MTAYGVLMAIEAAVEQVLGGRTSRASGSPCRVSAMSACRSAATCGSAAPGSPSPTPTRHEPAQAEGEHGAELVDPDAIYDQEVDLFAPCALGAVLNDRTIPRLRCRLVCGGANNQLAAAAHDDALAARGITFVPDYLANAGGVIDFYQEVDRRPPRGRAGSVERIRGITADVLQRAAPRARRRCRWRIGSCRSGSRRRWRGAAPPDRPTATPSPRS